MSIKQDRQGVRTPADLERKYNFASLAAAAKETKLLESRFLQLSDSVYKHDQSIRQLENMVGGGGTTALFLNFQVEDGDLYLYTNDEETANNFEYDESTGELYYVMEAE